MAFHKNEVGPNLHGSFNWEFADETARLAATGFTAADVTQRKLVLQFSDKSQWILTNHSPIVWAQLSGTGSDEIIEVDNYAALPVTGEIKKIYVTKDNNLTYRWSGSAYVEISASLALGETSATAYRGDRGKTAYDHSQVATGNPHGTTKTDLTLGNVTNDAQIKAADFPAASVDSEIVAFSSTSGKVVKRLNSLTGIPLLTAGVISASSVTNDAQLKRSAGDIASLTEKAVVVGADIVLVEDSADTNAKKRTTAQAIANLASVASPWPVYRFEMNMLLNPNNSGWAVNGLANLAVDASNTAIPVRQMDDTAVEGFGFKIYISAGATNMIFRWRGRAATAPATGKKVALGLYSKGMPDAAAVTAWSSITNIQDTIEIAANAYYLYDTSTISLSTLGLTADRLYLFEMVRVGSDATYDTLVGDWLLAHFEVTFS